MGNCCQQCCDTTGRGTACIFDRNSCLCACVHCRCLPCVHSGPDRHIVSLDPGSTWASLMQHHRHDSPGPPGLAGLDASEADPQPAATTALGLHARLRHYATAHPFKTGDVLAYNSYPGENWVRDAGRAIARTQTHAKITHVAMLYVHEETGKVFTVEAEWDTDTKHTTEYFTGGVYSRQSMWVYELAHRVENVAAELYHLPLRRPLSAEARAKADAFMLERYLADPPFDYASMYTAGMDTFDGVGGESAKDDFSRLFCAEFVTGTLKAAGVIGSEVNASEMTPADVWGFDVWERRAGGDEQPEFAMLKRRGEYSPQQPSACLSCYTRCCMCLCPCVCKPAH